MSVLIDPPHWPAHGRLWAHLVSDTSLAELHDFAARVGLPRRGFDADHYDVPAERHADAVAAGAQPVEGRELLRRLQASGLRRPKRHSDRLLASSPVDERGLRVDALAGALVSRPAPSRVTVLTWFEGSLLMTGRVGTAPPQPPVVEVTAGTGLAAPVSSVTAAAADLDLQVARTALAAWLGLGDRGLQVTRLGQLRTVQADTGRPVSTTSVIRVVTPWRGAPVAPAHWWRLPLLLGRLDPLIEAFVTGSQQG